MKREYLGKQCLICLIGIDWRGGGQEQGRYVKFMLNII
jgi:hypothetical protein